MYSRSPNTDGNMDFLNQELDGIDKCNHGIHTDYQKEWDHYDKGYQSIPAEHLMSAQAAKYQGNK